MRLMYLFPAALAVASIAAGGVAQTQTDATPPPGEGLDIMMTRCTGCHPINQVFAAPPKTAQAWAQTVRAMAEAEGLDRVFLDAGLECASPAARCAWR